MNIIADINSRVDDLARLGLTDTDKVRKALSSAITDSPNRNPSTILQQAYIALLNNYYGGSTEYVRGE